MVNHRETSFAARRLLGASVKAKMLAKTSVGWKIIWAKVLKVLPGKVEGLFLVFPCTPRKFKSWHLKRDKGPQKETGFQLFKSWSI